MECNRVEKEKKKTRGFEEKSNIWRKQSAFTRKEKMDFLKIKKSLSSSTS